MDLKITTLIENNQDAQKNLCCEHGLSMVIEVEGKQILFDTGQTGNFMKNVRSLNKDLTALDYIIMSHGHYDHSGGFETLVDEVEKLPQIIVGEEFFKPKYEKLSEKEYKYNGNSFDEEFIKNHDISLKKIKEDTVFITEHIIVFHHFKRKNGFEKRVDKFYVKENLSYLPDEFADEIVLGIVTKKGLVVLVGCSHVGVVNILHEISERVDLPIYAVIGGTHLIEDDETRIQRTIEAFKEMDISLVAVSHCTGEEGIRLIRDNFKDRFLYNCTGQVIEI